VSDAAWDCASRPEPSSALQGAVQKAARSGALLQVRVPETPPSLSGEAARILLRILAASSTDLPSASGHCLDADEHTEG